MRGMQKGEGPETDQRDRRRAPSRCPEIVPKRAQQGPDSDHQRQGTKTARHETPKPGQKDNRWTREGLREENCDIGEAERCVRQDVTHSRFNMIETCEIDRASADHHDCKEAARKTIEVS